MTDAPLVPREDVDVLLPHFRPGSVVLSATLYSRYVALMETENRSPASRYALGRALSRAGWDHKLIRKSRGPRGRQRQTGSWAWVVPGRAGLPPITEEDDRMCVTLRVALGGRADAFLTEDLIWDTYQAQLRRHGWRGPMNRHCAARWLTDKGFVRSTTSEHGQRAVSRYVCLPRVDRISHPS